MGLTMKQKQEVTKQIALDYRRASKKKRGETLDWLVALTGYNRSYASRVLRQRAKPKVLGKLRGGGIEVTIVEDERTKRRKRTRSRPRKYGKEVIVALRKIWVICDCICGKRLAPYLSEILPVLKRWGELEIDDEGIGTFLNFRGYDIIVIINGNIGTLPILFINKALLPLVRKRIGSAIAFRFDYYIYGLCIEYKADLFFQCLWQGMFLFQVLHGYVCDFP